MITLVAAISRNRCIGMNGQLVWRNKEDMAHFKSLTSGAGKTVLMGRKTWESIPEKFRPLPDRVNAVVTRQSDYVLPPGVMCFNNLRSTLHILGRETDLYVIGGAEIYAAALPLADTLELTEIDKDIEGDTFFPEVDLVQWTESSRITREGFAFVTYARTEWR